VIRFGASFGSNLPTHDDRMPAFPERFVLFVSAIEARKNHVLLVHVWERLLERHGSAQVPTLVFFGGVNWLARDLLAELESKKYLDGKIVRLSGFSDAVLAEAYRRCLFTVFPSLSEGWGLPVAESLACGKFCITSNRASLPEVGGDFVDYFDPTSVEDALAKIERALFAPGYLAGRVARIKAEYVPPSWSDCARTIVATLDATVMQPGGGAAAPPDRAVQIGAGVIRSERPLAPTPKRGLAYWLATWFGVGLIWIAPGTAGTIVALPVHWALATLPLALHLALIAALLAAGIWSAGRLADLLAQADPPVVVIDEVAGALLALVCVSGRGLLWQLVTLLLFRLLDILKPWPIYLAERCKPTGLGIMADDVVAGLAAGFIVYLA
jgi:phosphatidylglycerophosphatase A